MSEDRELAFDLPSVARKKVTCAFDGGAVTSDGGVLLLAQADKRCGIVDRLAALIPDRRDGGRVTHSLASIIRARAFAIACGYEDANDLDRLRSDPAMKLACGRPPESGNDLCSQPTVSRFENAPDLRTVIRLTYGLVDAYCASFPIPPEAVTLDIDDTFDAVHGGQQLSLFNAHHDGYGFKPIHVYDMATAKPVAVVLRGAKTPSGKEVRGWIRRLVGRIRAHWPAVKITIRGDSHYGRTEAMAWCESHDVAYVFGLQGNEALRALFAVRADAICLERAEAQVESVRGYAEAAYAAGSWDRARRVIARLEASPQGFDARYVVTNLDAPSPERPEAPDAETVYDELYCVRGQAENLIKLHKTQLKSDRTSCCRALANQVRLVLHTAAYWLMLTVRDAIPKGHALAKAEFATIRVRLLKLGARIRATAHRVRVAFAAACPDAALMPAGP